VVAANTKGTVSSSGSCEMRYSPAIVARPMNTGTAMTVTAAASSTTPASATSVPIAGVSLRVSTNSSRLSSVTLAAAEIIKN